MKSDFQTVKASVGEEFTIRAWILKKLRETTLSYPSGSKFVYKIVPGTEKISGLFKAYKGVPGDIVISPKEVKNSPKLTDFEYENYPIIHSFKCTKKGKAYLNYLGGIKWDEEVNKMFLKF